MTAHPLTVALVFAAGVSFALLAAWLIAHDPSACGGHSALRWPEEPRIDCP